MLKVLKKITSNGYQAYLVGGYPRDLYMNKISYDILENEDHNLSNNNYSLEYLVENYLLK